MSLIMDAFRIGYYVGYQSCVSAVLGVYPVIHATHTMAQASSGAHLLFNQVIIFQQLQTLRLFCFGTALGQVTLRIMCSLLQRKV